MTKLNDQEFMRYNRHIMMEQVGEAGQVKFGKTKVLVIGLGGLGCPAAQYLAASGIGHLTLVDHDTIEISNLQRQILYRQQDVGEKKVVAAKKALSQLNPLIELEAIDKSIFDFDLEALIGRHDVVLDCTDSAKTRQNINVACKSQQVLLVSASAIQGSGQLISFDFSDPQSPCYQCLFPDSIQAPKNCATSGVLSPLLGIMGSMQATETLRLLLGKTDNLNQLSLFDAWGMAQQKFKLNRSAHCSVCSAD